MLAEHYLHTISAPCCELEEVFRREGRDYFSDRSIVRETEKDEKQVRKIERFVRTVFRVAEKTEDVAESVTASSLSALTLIRKSGFRGGLLPWEVWSEERGVDLREVHQRILVRDWLSDSLFSKEILNSFERVSPEFSVFWGNRFDEIADHMIDSPAKTALGSAFLAFMEGTATISGEASGSVAVGRIFVGQISKALDSLSNNVTNEMRGVIEYLASDIRQVVCPYDPKLSAETITSQIVTAGISEFSYRVATVSALSSWFGSSAGITLVGLLHDGVSSLGKSVAYSGGMLASIGYLGRHFRISLLQKYSEEFARVTGEISSVVQRRTRLVDVEFTPGLGEYDEALQRQRHVVTKEKNYIASAVSDGLPSTLSSTAYLFHSGADYAGLALMIGRSVKEILAVNDTYVAFKASIAARTRAFKQLNDSLAHVQGERAPLTDKALGKYVNYDIDWKLQPFLVGLKMIGIPHTPRREKQDLSFVGVLDSSSVYYLCPGSISLLIGENGDGKSTLIKTLTGEYAGNIAGTDINWSGLDIRLMPVEERRKRVFSLTNTIHGDFRQLVGTILLKYDSALTTKKYDKTRIRNWITSDVEDVELEADVLSYFSRNDLLKGMNKSWFKKGYCPSGYEGAVLNYAAHLSIREPVLMIIDEFDNGMTVGNLKSFMQGINLLMDDFNGALVVCSNKQLAGWLELERTAGYIDMRDGLIIDRKFNTSTVEKLIQKEKLAEFQYKFEHRQPMSLEEFYTWMTLPGSPRDLHIAQMKKLYEELGYESFQVNFEECGIYDWENGEYGKYLVDNLERWISVITTRQEMLTCLRNLNLFYCTHFYMHHNSVRVRRDLRESLKVGNNWSNSLRMQFNQRLNDFILEHNQSLSSVIEGRNNNPEEYIFTHQFSLALDKSSNFLDFYAHNYALQFVNHLFVNLFLQLTSDSNVDGETFVGLFDDPIFIYSIGNFGKQNPTFIASLVRYIRSCSTHSELNCFFNKLKSYNTITSYLGEHVNIWEYLMVEPWFKDCVEERIGMSAMMMS